MIERFVKQCVAMEHAYNEKVTSYNARRRSVAQEIHQDGRAGGSDLRKPVGCFKDSSVDS